MDAEPTVPLEAPETPEKRGRGRPGRPGRPSLNIDWDGIRRDFIRGLTVPEIARKYGVAGNTIHQRAWREDWKALTAQAKDVVGRAIADVIQSQKALVQQTVSTEIEEWQREIKEVNRDILGRVKYLVPTIDKLDAAQKAAGAVNVLDSTVRRAMGMDDKGPTDIRLNLAVIGRPDDLLASLSPRTTVLTAKPTNSQPAIDAGAPMDYKAGDAQQVVDIAVSPAS